MTTMTRLSFALTFVLTPALTAQESHDHAPAGERLGRVVFPISCAAPARQRFERAVAYLHSFWYEQATTAFGDVVATDSTCAMAYWGRAMALWHLLWTLPGPTDLAAGLATAEHGVGLARTPRERAYLEAIATYYRDYQHADPTARLLAYVGKMAALQRANPDDREAAIFYSLALIAVGQANPTDTTFAYQKRADSILEPLYKLEPQHPGLAHYLIHANDAPPLASHGLYAARHYAAIAPDVPHALHMPSHTFTLLGLWDEAIVSNTRSAAAAQHFEQAQHLNALWDQRAHDWDYLVYADLQLGEDRAAKAIVDEAAGVTAVYPAGSLINEYALAAIPARFALERGQWPEAAQLAVRPAPQWRAAEAITHFARALGEARSGDPVGLSREIAALGQIAEGLRQAGGPQTYWAEQVKNQLLVVAAWSALVVSHDTGAALGQAKAAADVEDVTAKHPVTPGPVLPARELYGDLLVAAGRYTEAANAYAMSLQNAPRRARSLFGLARAAELSGDLTTARGRYREYLTLMEQADGDRPELALARRALAAR